MSSSATSSSNFQHLFDVAVADYLEQTGVNLTDYPLAETLQSCQSADCADDVLDLLQVKVKQFKDYRDGNRKLIDRLKPLVHVLHTFSGILGDAASMGCMVPFQEIKAIFSGIDVLLGAAIAVGASYDALVDMFECVTNFLDRLRIYTEIPSTPIMTNTIVKIMVEVLSVLALATKQIKQGRFKKFAKKLLGESEIELVLQRLDRLTHDEARITVAQTLQVVCGLVSNMKVVMDNGEASMIGMRHALVTMQDMTNEINQMKRDQLQRDIRNWLSPPDPSTNHNIAWETHHTGSAAWFTKGSTFGGWTSEGSLLWIHGKPGSGKSVLCSSIVQEIKEKCDAGLALLCYHYFDFKDVAKQDIRGLLASLLAQLCAKSDSCNDVLSKLYSRHNAGSQQPDNHTLIECLKKMIQLPRQPMIYIIVDALDECPNTSGFPKTAREKVLDLLKQLVGLNVPNLRICVTSRPEIDIYNVLEPLASYRMSLHDESGQKKDIIDYVKAVVLSDQRMRKWRIDDRQIVIDTLSRKADGMFRWIVCQLDMLRRCFPSNLLDALNELPETLDETYGRILSGIEKEKREHARRLFQCLAVSIRPLRVQELAEILAMNWGSGNVPHYHDNWQLEDPREAVLSACSSLVTIVNVDGSPIVQFSHFSVKEYLTSDRLSKAGAELSRYHILSLSAHTILAQASLGVLLHLGSSVSKQNIGNFPFAMYAAQHWVDHARIEGVSSRIKDGIERLFDAEDPSFSTWTWIFDIDYPLKEHMLTSHPTRPEALPLYYATLCGFRDVVKWLLVTCAGEVNARGGYHGTPLHAALGKGDEEIAVLLLQHGADINALGREGWSALHIASQSGCRDHALFLLEQGADVNAKAMGGKTPLGFASWTGELDVARVLVQHGTAVDSRDDEGWTLLFTASRYGHSKMVEFLIQSGATVDSCDDDKWTPLYAASRYGHSKIVEFLIQRGVAVGSRGPDGWIPLYVASICGHLEIVRLLIQNGAAVDSLQDNGRTPLFAASLNGHLDVVQLLIKSGAAVNSRRDDGRTPLMAASDFGYLDVVHELLNRGADVNAHDRDLRSPLHFASLSGHHRVAALLIERGAEIENRAIDGRTPLDEASRNGHLEVVRLLLQRDSNPVTQNESGWTPLHQAAHNGHLEIVKLLLESGANPSMQNRNSKTPLDVAIANGKREVARFLLGCIGDVDSQGDMDAIPLDPGSRNSLPDIVQPSRGHEEQVTMAKFEGTSLHTASREGNADAVRWLLCHGADVNERNEIHKTPLCVASRDGKLDVAKELVKNGAGVNLGDKFGWTPLHCASRYGHLDIVQLLLDHSANVNASKQDGWSPLHLAAANSHIEIVRLLLERGAKADIRNQDGRTAFDEALRRGESKVVELLSYYSRCRV